MAINREDIIEGLERRMRKLGRELMKNLPGHGGFSTLRLRLWLPLGRPKGCPDEVFC
jgi:hypothetical protein